MADWIEFLTNLTRELKVVGDGTDLRPSAFLSLPVLDYASLLVASAFLTEVYHAQDPPPSTPSLEDFRPGDPIYLPLLLRTQNGELRRRVGVVEGIEQSQSGPQLEARLFDLDGKVTTRFVPHGLLPIVERANEPPDLEARTRGSVLAHNFKGLQMLLGESGACKLLRRKSKDCLIIDSKTRVHEESKSELGLSRLGSSNRTLSLFLRDLVRLESEGPAAMRETSCSKVTAEAEPGWKATIVAGCLNFLREWDNSDSKVRIALLCRSENAYGDALRFANDLYAQRPEPDLCLSKKTLGSKPSSIDVQLMFDR